ncbi:squalene synthetase-like protein, partial [Cymbomonas tetramitiformis]
EIISDITKRMGEGMAEFIPKEVVTTKEYETYCYYVAGLVGVGLSQLYAKSGLESDAMLQYNCMGTLADSMGQFLQQTNIIRDYLEDIEELPAPRMFWPRDIWSRYAPNGKLEDFKDPAHQKEALQCLNHMVSNALHHVPACLEYMKLCKDPKVFAFTAIPQVMAIATLALCYNNHNVFTGVVKIRKGLAAKLTVSTKNMQDVYTIFREFSLELVSKVRPHENPGSAQATMKAVAEIERICTEGLKEEIGATVKTEDQLSPTAEQPIDLGTRILLWLMFFGYFCYAWKLFGLRESLGVATPETFNRLDIMQMVVSLLAMAFVSKLCITGQKV